MKGATQCAQRLKSLISSLRSRLGKLSPPPGSDPITEMLLGILSRDVPETKARAALDQLRATVVDYNELRVIPSIELADMLGDYPEARLKCEDLSRALNKLFALTHTVTFEYLDGMPKKEAQAALEKIDGLEAYTVARIRLFGLGQHAVPLDEAMWAFARQAQIVDARCPLEEAQAFLERQIPSGEAVEFFTLVQHQAWQEMGDAVTSREVARILSVPPDRTTRNMLQMVGGAAVVAASPEPLSEDQDLAAEPPAEEPKKPTRRKATASRDAPKASTKTAKPKKSKSREAGGRSKKASEARAAKKSTKKKATKKKTAGRRSKAKGATSPKKSTRKTKKSAKSA